MHNRSVNIIFALLLAVIFVVNGCGEKKTDDPNSKNGSGETTDLVTKDPSGQQKVTLLMKPKKGDVFRYKVAGKQSQKETDAASKKSLESEQHLTYYATMEVADVDASNIITYKMKYDSLSITSLVRSGDSTVSTTYNSNIKDSVYNNPNFIDFNALVGEYFSLRVSPQGEVYDVLGTEKISEKIFKALGDTLKEDTKKSIREALQTEIIRRVMQVENNFIRFPDHAVAKDSSWTRTENSMIPPFTTKNIPSYKLVGIEEKDGKTLLTFDATLGIEFVEKEVKERGISVKLESSNAGGSGKIVFDLTRGIIVKKETSGKVEANIKLSDGKQSASSVQSSTNSFTMELL